MLIFPPYHIHLTKTKLSHQLFQINFFHEIPWYLENLLIYHNYMPVIHQVLIQASIFLYLVFFLISIIPLIRVPMPNINILMIFNTSIMVSVKYHFYLLNIYKLMPNTISFASINIFHTKNYIPATYI